MADDKAALVPNQNLHVREMIPQYPPENTLSED